MPTGTQFAPAEAPPDPAQAATPLPPIDSLTHESDFTPFMKADVDPGLRRQAFKKLIEDPQFNVMDGLDVYIDDYSKPDPLPEGWLEKMNQARHLGLFKAPEEDEVEPTLAVAPPPSEPLQEAIADQGIAEEAAVVPPVTSGAEIPPREVGKQGLSGEGF